MNGETSYASLFFFYNPSGKEIVFASLPFESFFGSIVSAKTEPPFVTSLDGSDREYLTKEWQSCLQLKEKETRNFSFSRITANNNLVFDFSVLCVVLSSLNDSPGLMVHVKKTMGPSFLDKSASNYQKDYAEFIELAGHDLDAPLRKLSVLVERLVARIDPVGDIAGYITRIQASLADMRSMIDGLSMLAAFTSSEVKQERCDMGDIVQRVVELLPGQYKNSIVITSSLPVLQGDSGQYKQLFKNLLDNAIVFSKKETAPRIEISAEPLQPEEQIRFALPAHRNYFKIVMADNGIGFRQEYAEKIFRPFIRLHGKSEYPGYGMGLAICKRIVENHHGIIYAEGKNEEGARFILILPQTII